MITGLAVVVRSPGADGLTLRNSGTGDSLQVSVAAFELCRKGLRGPRRPSVCGGVDETEVPVHVTVRNGWTGDPVDGGIVWKAVAHPRTAAVSGREALP